MQQQTQSIEDLRQNERRRRHMVARTLYNARDTTASFSHGGVPYSIPPDGPSAQRFGERPGISMPGLVEDKGTHAIYDGTLQIFDRYGVEAKVARQYRKKQKQGRDIPPPFPDKLIAAGLDIVEHALKKLGPAGVVMLTGDPVTDAQLKGEAKEQAIQFKKGQCERVLKNYRDRSEAFYRDPRNKGNFAPAMDDHESAAQAWLDEYRLGKKATKRFPCPENCGFATDDAKVLRTHLLASHPMVAEQHIKAMEHPEPVAQASEDGAVKPRRRGAA